MKLIFPAFAAVLIISACSTSDPRPDARIPESLTAPVPQPKLQGPTNGDLWKLLARQKAAIATGNSKLAAIRCIEDARQAIIDGEDVPECG